MAQCLVDPVAGPVDGRHDIGQGEEGRERVGGHAVTLTPPTDGRHLGYAKEGCVVQLGNGKIRSGTATRRATLAHRPRRTDAPRTAGRTNGGPAGARQRPLGARSRVRPAQLSHQSGHRN
ncbi:hypothetical protein GCM10009779_64190 [Polymorphospora rubra]|uniref:Uncharacterized protein n=1 Tax=Polymorphospora rubra TaxID=338584 RepID=A0A810N0H3_9ACTN|nr:hypothetical protein Prubr_21690 [Polymorphospora rubra]